MKITPNHSNELIKIILSELDAQNIVIVGDSHAQILSNLENIFICHLGPITAHNLCEDTSSTQGRIKLFNVIKQLNSNISIFFRPSPVAMEVLIISKSEAGRNLIISFSN